MARTDDPAFATLSDRAMAATSAGMSSRVWWTSIIYLATAAMFLRFYDLPLKPLHHDEGVNGWFMTRLVGTSESYHYDPANYHGPTLFYLALASVKVFGLTTVAVRLVTALSGFASVLLLLALAPYLGRVGALAAAILFALSPGAVYLSRYFIHESLLVCATIGTVICASMWCERKRPLYAYLAALSAGVMFATKETAILSAVVLVAALLLACAWIEIRDPGRRSGFREHPFRRVIDAAALGARHAVADLRHRRSILVLTAAAVIFVAVNVLFYTSFLTYWQGAMDALSTLAIWARTGTTAHTHPPYTYVAWLAGNELPVLVLGSAGAILALSESKNLFAVFAAFWAFGILALYSIIPYKTPWLTLNIVAPLAVTGGYTLQQIWQRRARLSRVARVTACGLVAYGAVQAVLLSFVQYDNESWPYVYAHTSREVLTLVREVDDLEALNPGATIAVASRDQFPLSWYLRGYPAGYYGRQPHPETSLVITSDDQLIAGDVPSRDRYDQIGTYRLRPGVRLVLFVRRDVKRREPSASSVAHSTRSRFQ